MPTRTTTQSMAKAASDFLGPDIKQMLERIPEAERFDMLMQLACSLACMATAEHRKDLHNEAEEFYGCVRKGTLSILSDLLPPLRGEDYTMEIHPDAKADIDADPALGAAVTDIMARVRQALDDVATGKYASVPEAMEAIGGKFVAVDPDDAVHIDVGLPDDDKGTLQ